MKTETQEAYLRILKRELILATGCTEPVSISLAAAIARETLGQTPSKAHVIASGNIIKNAKSVVVPNTGGLRGIPAAVAAGIVAGKSECGLEVISEISDEQKLLIKDYLDEHKIEVSQSNTNNIFDLSLTLCGGGSEVIIRICGEHTNVVHLEKDGEILLHKDAENDQSDSAALKDYELLNIADIVDFVEEMDISDVAEIIERQIELNTAIADEGLAHDYGANIGSTILASSYDIRTRAKALAAAASDARMSGCEMPVVILSGSGNQGITASLPVIEFAKRMSVSREKLIRAVTLSDLVTLHQKRYIGRLSAFCGVVSAGAACGAGIAYLHDGGFEEIAHTVVNALAMTSGMICDGAKPSCAAKIALAVEAGITGYFMFKNGQQFYSGDGIVKDGIEKTIQGIGVLGRIGMRETDETVLDLMLDREK